MTGNIPNFTLMLFLLLKNVQCFMQHTSIYKTLWAKSKFKAKNVSQHNCLFKWKKKKNQHTHTTVYVFFWLIHFNDIWHGVWLRFLFSYTLNAAKIQDDFFLESALFLHGKTPCASHRLRSQIAHTHSVKGLFIISKTWGTSLLYFVILGVCLIHMASTYIYGTDGKHFGTYGKH